ncbi:MAG: hypothetical protein U1A27_11145 [Phycisphaerae bacterium]
MPAPVSPILRRPVAPPSIGSGPPRAADTLAVAAPASPWRACRLPRADWLLTVGLFAAALLARWPLISQGQTLLHPDEAVVGVMAQDIAAGRHYPIYFYGQRYMGALEAYVVAALLAVCDRPIVALRMAPALFFAALVAVQSRMVGRWFGRWAGLLAGGVLIAAPPMMAQWSISARGGYIEILLWGTLLWWAYGAWFADTAAPATGRQRFVLGLIAGSGFWINPSIILFVLPLAARELLRRFGRADRAVAALSWPRRANALADRLGRTALPVAVLAAVALVNCVHAVWAEDGQVQTRMLLGLLPARVAAPMIAVVLAAAAVVVAWRTGIVAAARTALTRQAWLLAGAIVGAGPALLYAIGGALGWHALEPALPLAIRPIWKVGDPLLYLARGAAVLYGADPRPFTSLVTVGRPAVTSAPAGAIAAALPACNAVVATGLALLAAVLAWGWRERIWAVLRLRRTAAGPCETLLLALAASVGLYLLGAASHDFMTIRYLVPAWAFVPGLVAAAVARRRALPRAVQAVPIIGAGALLVAWSVGQAALATQIGRAHPLQAAADALVERGVPACKAELLDAHLLSYLTRQRCCVGEFEPFWPRLAKFEPRFPARQPTAYLVDPTREDWTDDWVAAGWPGQPPPETLRTLWPRLRAHLRQHPADLLAREALPDGFELITLRDRLPETRRPQ